MMREALKGRSAGNTRTGAPDKGKTTSREIRGGRGSGKDAGAKLTSRGGRKLRWTESERTPKMPVGAKKKAPYCRSYGGESHGEKRKRGKCLKM